MQTIKTKNLEELNSRAQEFVASLHGGALVGLIGPLGAGKTAFVKSVAKILGIKKAVVSPTFTLLQTYNLTPNTYNLKRLVHIDCYRLHADNPDAAWRQLLAAGLEDWFDRDDALIIIEWADRLPKKIQKQFSLYTLERQQ